MCVFFQKKFHKQKKSIAPFCNNTAIFLVCLNMFFFFYILYLFFFLQKPTPACLAASPTAENVTSKALQAAPVAALFVICANQHSICLLQRAVRAFALCRSVARIK